MRQIRSYPWTLCILLFIVGKVSAAPCTAVANCTQWLTIGSGPERVLLYRTFPLETKNTDITRVVIVIHGAGRDADKYFRHMTAAAFLAGALENTLVISPRFASNNERAPINSLKRKPTGPAAVRLAGRPAARV